jgi:hypothetical protein
MMPEVRFSSGFFIDFLCIYTVFVPVASQASFSILAMSSSSLPSSW